MTMTLEQIETALIEALEAIRKARALAGDTRSCPDEVELAELRAENVRLRTTLKAHTDFMAEAERMAQYDG